MRPDTAKLRHDTTNREPVEESRHNSGRIGDAGARFATSGHTENRGAVSEGKIKTRRRGELFERSRPRTARLRSEAVGTKKNGGGAEPSVSREENTATKTQSIRAAAHDSREDFGSSKQNRVMARFLRERGHSGGAAER
jgi:hypothetical protein